MRTILAALLASAAAGAAAETLVYRDATGTAIRLLDGPCEGAAAEGLNPEKLGELRAARGDFVTEDGEPLPLAGCWKLFEGKEFGGGAYAIWWEDGDVYVFRRVAFRPEGL